MWCHRIEAFCLSKAHLQTQLEGGLVGVRYTLQKAPGLATQLLQELPTPLAEIAQTDASFTS